MSDMEEQWRGHWKMATVSNILLGGSRSFQFACANFCSEYCEYFQEICIYVYAGHPQVWDSQGNLSLVVYAKSTERKCLLSWLPQKDQDMIQVLDTWLLSYPCQSRWSYWQWPGLKQIWLLWKIRKKAFLEASKGILASCPTQRGALDCFDGCTEQVWSKARSNPLHTCSVTTWQAGELAGG